MARFEGTAGSQRLVKARLLAAAPATILGQVHDKKRGTRTSCRPRASRTRSRRDFSPSGAGLSGAESSGGDPKAGGLPGASEYGQEGVRAAEELNLSARSLKRLVRHYRDKGIEGLKRQVRSDEGRAKVSEEWQKCIVNQVWQIDHMSADVALQHP